MVLVIKQSPTGLTQVAAACMNMMAQRELFEIPLNGAEDIVFVDRQTPGYPSISVDGIKYFHRAATCTVVVYGDSTDHVAACLEKAITELEEKYKLDLDSKSYIARFRTVETNNSYVAYRKILPKIASYTITQVNESNTDSRRRKIVKNYKQQDSMFDICVSSAVGIRDTYTSMSSSDTKVIINAMLSMIVYDCGNIIDTTTICKEPQDPIFNKAIGINVLGLKNYYSTKMIVTNGDTLRSVIASDPHNNNNPIMEIFICGESFKMGNLPFTKVFDGTALDTRGVDTCAACLTPIYDKFYLQGDDLADLPRDNCSIGTLRPVCIACCHRVKQPRPVLFVLTAISPRTRNEAIDMMQIPLNAKAAIKKCVGSPSAQSLDDSLKWIRYDDVVLVSDAENFIISGTIAGEYNWIVETVF